LYVSVVNHKFFSHFNFHLKVKRPVPPPAPTQKTLATAFNTAKIDEMHKRQAECFYGLNIPMSVADQPLFKQFVQTLIRNQAQVNLLSQTVVLFGHMCSQRILSQSCRSAEAAFRFLFVALRF